MKKKYLIVGVLIIVEIISIFFMYKSSNKNIILDDVSITSEKNKMLAMYVGKGDTYEEYEGETFPKGYTLNTSKSTCVDINGQEVPGAISTDETGNIKITSNKTLYCYIYLDLLGRACKFDGELTSGATFTDDQYTYRYKYRGSGTSWTSMNDDGWGVMLTDKNSTNPVTDEEICTSINGKPVVSMSYMFAYSKASSIDVTSFETQYINNMSNMFYNTTATNIIGYEDFNTSQVTSMSYMFAKTNIDTINISKYQTPALSSTSYMFNESKATTINLGNLNTSQVTNMNYMFKDAAATIITGYENFDTSQVTSMSHMFANTKILDIDISNYNTSKVKDFSSIFSYAKATNITGYEDFDFTSATDIGGVFYGTNIPTIDISKWKTSNITGMGGLFNNSKATEIIGLKNLDTSNVTNMFGMFQLTNVSTIDVSNFNTSNVTDMGLMFNNSKATTIVGLGNFDTSRVTSMYGMFTGSPALTIDVSSFDTSKVKEMNVMFSGAKATEIKGYENFDTSQVTTMHDMFENTNISTIDVRKYKTSQVKDMDGMFEGAKATTITGYENFDTSKVTNMSNMFKNTNISTINISNYSTPVLTNTSYMFQNSKATSINLGSLNTSLVTNMSYMFDGAKATTITGLNNLKTPLVTNMSYMFRNTVIPTLDLSSFDTTNVTNMSNMFYKAAATVGYARTQEDLNRFNASSGKPETLKFTVKSS